MKLEDFDTVNGVDTHIIHCSEYEIDEIKKHCSDILDLERQIFDLTGMYSHFLDAPNLEIILCAICKLKYELKECLSSAKKYYEVE